MPTPAAALPHGQGQVVLIVEDEEAIRQALVESLGLLNYRTMAAPTVVRRYHSWPSTGIRLPWC